ncbi:hypothetical protein Cgig2_015690 [Carnegiea gigantea]|uniref:RNase H type-1 domain-containing protein n=1 Tax=Carnegiea gigantea TaxID=171969 RepID=A0A9Q1Q6B1_9CARY|nr:hypothetical protein Cgig2_015690 [Carnegiea gigantea]
MKIPSLIDFTLSLIPPLFDLFFVINKYFFEEGFSIDVNVWTSALKFIGDFKKMAERIVDSGSIIRGGPSCPQPGCWKINFDGEKLRDWDHRWGMGLHGPGNGGGISLSIRSPRCSPSWVPKYSIGRGLPNLDLEDEEVTEHSSELGLILDDILNLSRNLEFCAFSFVYREGNKVAHSIAHLQPYVSGSWRLSSYLEVATRSSNNTINSKPIKKHALANPEEHSD